MRLYLVCIFIGLIVFALPLRSEAASFPPDKLIIIPRGEDLEPLLSYLCADGADIMWCDDGWMFYQATGTDFYLAVAPDYVKGDSWDFACALEGQAIFDELWLFSLPSNREALFIQVP